MPLKAHEPALQVGDRAPVPDNGRVTRESPPPTWISRVRRFEVWIWVAVLAAVLTWRWPLVKGWVYRASETPPPAASFEWRTDFDAALAESARVGRPVFVDFQATWCPPCIAMAHDVWPDPEVGRLLTERYVPVSVDVDRHPAIADRYAVRGIPTILVLDSQGRVLRTAWFMSRGGIINFLRDDGD